MTKRGSYNFEVTETGDIINSTTNVELLRKLWLDSQIISRRFGPGNRGDFDNGAWHVACHLVAAGCVKKTSAGNLMWLEISHDKTKDLYYPSLSIKENNNILTIDLNSSKALELLKNSTLLGFIEGTSEGRISAKGIQDARSRFNGWPRQDFDMQPGDTNDGGKVWEHWCTVRDIRKTSDIGSSVIKAYIALVSSAGDKFVPTVARGRLDYEHPTHLRAMVQAGFTSLESARWDIKPTAIPDNIDLILQEATPEKSLVAAEQLTWENNLKYYMFKRRINRWNNNNLP